MARSLLDLGHSVVLHARSAERAEALSGIVPPATPVVFGDLRSARETRKLADQVNAIGRMDAVICNAGIYAVPSRDPTPEGHASTLAVNTLSAFILTALITRPARLIYLSSSLHRGGEGSLADIDWVSRPWNAARAYAESKLQVAALAAGLARRWPDTITSAVDPGWVRTRMGGHNATVDLDTGQRTQSWLAVSDDPAALVSGCYWHDMRRDTPAGEVTDTIFQDRLIEQLAVLTGLSLP